MKKCRQYMAWLLLCLLCVSTIQVHAQEKQTEDYKIAERIEKAKELGLEAWIDEEGYLVEDFLDGKSDAKLSELGVEGLVRTLGEEELAAYVSNLNMGIAVYTVTRYQKVSQINPSTGKYLYTGIFEVDGVLAYCIERSMATPAKGSPTGNKTLVTNENLRKVLYYGYNGPAAKGYTYVETALAAGEANGDGDNSLGRNVLAEIKAYASPPSSFKVWKVETNGGSTQDLAFYTVEANGYGKVRKVSESTAITDGNDCYSLQGAVYGVYSNSACTAEVGRVTTGADGNSGTITLKPGTYYLKEILSPKGYLLNHTVYPFTVTASQTTIVSATDVPETIVPDMLVEKVDAETGLGIAQGDGTLEDALFQVKYYKGEYAEGVNPADLGKTADREWVFATDEGGKIYFREAYLVSGDALFKNVSSQSVLPFGTITIQEIAASDGYRINEEIFVKKIKSGEKELQPITVQESVLWLELTKYQEDSEIPLENAVFLHTNPDGTTETKRTDSDGRLVWKGLQEGIHQLEEVSAPEGFLENRNVIIFAVDENHQITVNSEVDESFGKVRTLITEEGNLKIEVEDKIGYKLPETGSAKRIYLYAVGIGCCLAAMKGKRRKCEW